jgi:hypothetical protein
MPNETPLDLAVLFEEHNDEFLKGERITPERRLHKRPDINAFILLDRLIPGEHDIVTAASHDEIYLGIECDELAKVATEEDIIDLIRCGVRYDNDTESLCMFV